MNLETKSCHWDLCQWIENYRESDRQKTLWSCHLQRNLPTAGDALTHTVIPLNGKWWFLVAFEASRPLFYTHGTCRCFPVILSSVSVHFDLLFTVFLYCFRIIQSENFYSLERTLMTFHTKSNMKVKPHLKVIYNLKIHVRMRIPNLTWISHCATIPLLAAPHFQYISRIMPMMSSFVCPITIPMPRPSALLL